METEADTREMPAIELALLQRGVDERLAELERCDSCGRTPLIGEQVYLYEQGAVVCELCRTYHGELPLDARTVHGEEFGHTIRLIDRRAA